MKHISADGCTLAYHVYGDAKTTVFLLHGFGVDGRMWTPQQNALPEYRVIVPDIRGHGESRPCSSFSVVQAAKDIHQIACAEQCEKPILVGLSMGGYVVQEYMRLLPDALSGCMIVGATPIFMHYKRWETVSLRYSGALLRMYPWGYLKKAMARTCCVTDEGRRMIGVIFDDMTKEEFISSWSGIATCLHETDLTVKVPMLFTYGEHDRTGTIRLHAGDWAQLYPHCGVKVIPNAAHVANLDNIDFFNDIIRAFVARCNPADS
jgi:pimeloyl-ACP methyl ester carboxylesterase